MLFLQEGNLLLVELFNLFGIDLSVDVGPVEQGRLCLLNPQVRRRSELVPEDRDDLGYLTVVVLVHEELKWSVRDHWSLGSVQRACGSDLILDGLSQVGVLLVQVLK